MKTLEEWAADLKMGIKHDDALMEDMRRETWRLVDRVAKWSLVFMATLVLVVVLSSCFEGLAVDPQTVVVGCVAGDTVTFTNNPDGWTLTGCDTTLNVPLSIVGDRSAIALPELRRLLGIGG